VDRIRGRARLAPGAAFDIPADFDVAQHVARPAFLLRRDGAGARVAVELRPEVAFMAQDALREGWTFDELPGGGGLLRFEATDRAAVIRFVAKHCERARIVEPAALRDEAKAYFKDILAAHTGEPDASPRGKRARR
jgi:hypothetical protein